MHTRFTSPEDAVTAAKLQGCLGISWTFNEPALWFEYTLDSAKQAKTQGLFTNYVTNGYMTAEAFTLLAAFLDVYRVDIKGFTEKTYKRISRAWGRRNPCPDKKGKGEGHACRSGDKYHSNDQ